MTTLNRIALAALVSLSALTSCKTKQAVTTTDSVTTTTTTTNSNSRQTDVSPPLSAPLPKDLPPTTAPVTGSAPLPPDSLPHGTTAIPGRQPANDKEAGANIQVASPPANATIHFSPFPLTGLARTFENMVSYRLTLDDGTVLDQGHVQAAGPMGTLSQFRTMVKAGKTGKAKLEVFQNSAKDGSEADKVTIPLTLAPPAK